MKEKRNHHLTYAILLCLLLVNIVFPCFMVTGGPIDEYVFMIENPRDYEQYGFKDHGYYYTPEALTQFYMPLVIEKQGSKIDSLSKNDLSYKIPDHLSKNKECFTKRNPIIDYQVLDENRDYILVLASMTVEASTEGFSIDFVPTIKGQDISKFAWWNSSWNYRKNITIDHRQVEENLYGFPVLVNVTDSDIAAHAQEDGDDLVFVGSDYVTILPHEIEYYNNTNGRLVAWVNLTNISSSVNTTFYMYYGNPGCSNQQDNEGTWDQYYVGVWHCQNLSGNLWDSTGNLNDGAVHGSPTYNQSGLFGRSILMDANSEYFQVANSNSMDFSDNITVYAVYQQIASNDESDYIITTRSGEQGFWLRVAHGGSDGRFEFATGNSSLQEVQTSGTYTSTSEWYHSIGTYNRSAVNERRIWIQGHEQSVNSDTNEFNRSDSDWYIGNYLGGSYSMDGYLEELRVSSIVRSDAWLNTSYNMMVNSSDGEFITFGSETLAGNSSPSIDSYSPADGSTVIDTSTLNVSVRIVDFNGDLFNYTIETSPDIGHRYGNLTSNGTKICNVSNVLYGTTYTVYVNATDPYGSGNWTNISYSFTTIGGLRFNCFNESNPSQAIDFDIEISNQDGSQVYTASNISNGHSINISQTPTGDNTIIIVSNSSYETRVYYYDIDTTTFYNLSFYLPPLYQIVQNETVDTNLYTIRVIDDYAYPVADADVTIKRYNNVTGVYEIVTSLVTNGYGESDAYLIPNTNYKFFVTKTGFQDFVNNSFTDPLFYGKNYPIILQVITDPSSEPSYGFWDIITFNASMMANNTIEVHYVDSFSETGSAVFYTYESYNGTLTLVSTNSTTSSSFTFYVTGVNSSRQHIIDLVYSHTTLGTGNASFIVLPLREGLHGVDAINLIFGNIMGTWTINSGGLGYVEFFFIVLPTLMLIAIASKKSHAGAGVFLGGCYMGFSSFVIFDVPTTLISGGLVVTICALGIVHEVVKGGFLRL